MALASNQHGRVSHAQLLELGFGRGAIHHRALAGRLHREHRGVYALGHRAVTRESREMAAVLACGLVAVVSHWTAAARWRLLRPTAGLIHVSAPGDHRIKGIRIHRVQEFHAHDLTRRDGIPITTVPRTLLDLAAIAAPNVLARAVNQADRQGLLNRHAVHQLLQRNPRRRGTRRLRSLIDRLDPQTGRTRSDLEVDFRKLCRRYRIPAPISNEEVGGYEVDMYWPEGDLIVELDHYDYHRTRAEFTADRRKWAHLNRLGHKVLPISDEWLNNDPRGVAETVIVLLAQPGDTGGSIACSE